MAARSARPVRRMAFTVILVSGLTTLALTLSASAYLFLDDATHTLRAYADYMAESLAYSSIDPLLTEAYVSLEGVVETFRGRRDIAEAYVVNGDGRVVASLDRGDLGKLLPSTGAGAPDDGPFGWGTLRAGSFTVSRSVLYLGTRLGEAVVGLSLDGVRRRVAVILARGVAVGACALSAALLVGLGLSRRVSGPLEALASRAAGIARGEPPGNAPASAIREIAILGETVIGMARKLDAGRRSAESALALAAAARDESSASAARLSDALEEKTVLLREIHHRVKNNLQVIISLLHLEQEEMSVPTDAQVLEQAEARIRSMAIVHEMLYRSDDLSDIDMREYFDALCADIGRSASRGDGVRLVLDVDAVTLSIEDAIPLGLIANELISNALKHGLGDRDSGTIRLSLGRSGGCYRFSVSDDGGGTPSGRPPEPSLGLTLIGALADQLGASVEWRWDGMASARICFAGHGSCSARAGGAIMGGPQ